MAPNTAAGADATAIPPAPIRKATNPIANRIRSVVVRSSLVMVSIVVYFRNYLFRMYSYAAVMQLDAFSASARSPAVYRAGPGGGPSCSPNHALGARPLQAKLSLAYANPGSISSGRHN